MASREERCSKCGIVLVVPQDVHVFKCAVCNGITHIIPTKSSSFSHAYSNVAARFRGFLSNVMMSSSSNSRIPNYGSTNSGFCCPQNQSSIIRPISYPMMPPPAYGSKRAVLCGICYHGKSYKLKGSVNDVKCMKYFLMNKFGFPSESILMLTDDKDEKDPLRIPTKHNIQMALRWLIEGAKSGDSLVFHYSGHGTQEVDLNMDEIDGYDEAICPVDFEQQGKIIDDEINAIIVRPLPNGAKLHAIIDACHSGTVLDLPFVFKINREGYYTWEDHRTPLVYKGTRGGLAICISACDDDQVSVDTSVLTGREVTGALTFSLIQAMENEAGGLTYGQLLSAIRSIIRNSNNTNIVRLNGPFASMLNRVLGQDIKQEAQVSSSEIFDINSKRFVL